MTRGGPATYDRDVEVTLGGTAQRFSDYDVTGPIVGDGGSFFTVRIAAGQSTATVTVTPRFNPAVEGAETVVVTVEGTSGTVTIADEPAATLAVTDAAASELGGDLASFTVTRGGPATYDRDVEVTLGGTAQRFSDYDVTGPIVGDGGSFFTVRIAAGQSTATVTVTPRFNPAVEGAETVVVTVEGTSGTVTIADEPAASELGGDLASFTVTRGGPATYDRDVEVTLGGTAQRFSDYDVTGPIVGDGGSFFTVRIAAGQNTATVTVTPIADGTAEPDETVILMAEGTAATATIADEPLGEP